MCLSSAPRRFRARRPIVDPAVVGARRKGVSRDVLPTPRSSSTRRSRPKSARSPKAVVVLSVERTRPSRATIIASACIFSSDHVVRSRTPRIGCASPKQWCRSAPATTRNATLLLENRDCAYIAYSRTKYVGKRPSLLVIRAQLFRSSLFRRRWSPAHLARNPRSPLTCASKTAACRGSTFPSVSTIRSTRAASPSVLFPFSEDRRPAPRSSPFVAVAGQTGRRSGRQADNLR